MGQGSLPAPEGDRQRQALQGRSIRPSACCTQTGSLVSRARGKAVGGLPAPPPPPPHVMCFLSR